MPLKSRSSGLALVEVMVALAVVAIALPALLSSVEAGSNTAAHVRDKAMAQWIAGDRITERRILRRLGQTQKDESSGEVEMAGQRWQWRTIALRNTNEDFRTMETTVFREGEDPLVTLTAVEKQ
ncbi:type II secretion system minor pseudopilin GspI [Porticoccus sp. W117]|uniref:type II secretion system minor pseudopilin GspI n=1 Tax=Porticoccus sp. W117 TaxID=3054777 RepID=UPI00259204F4|nr:type II secretion system minor pseudopilin GspI [Porticoccus sp. W117]MDM3869759.1 type II secretion system minor pseudopilin GspI [Porticoccus sp. W117]